MSVKCKYIVNIMEKIAPPHLSLSFDNTGMIIGDEDADISSVLVALDINECVIEEAVLKGCELIITHHPVIFSPIRSLNVKNHRENLLHKIIQSKINIYSAHTNLDITEKGINDFLAKGIGLNNITILDKTYEEKLYKIAVYVPEDHADIVRGAMTLEGAGFIGNYSDCTFNICGTGTFKPLEGTSPFIGKTNNMEQVREIKIETIVSAEKLHTVINKMLAAHPYEEVAYDVYLLNNGGKAYGIGRIGTMETAVTLMDLCLMIKNALGINSVNVTGNLESKISKVAICSGSGADYIKKVFAAGCDAYITGDIKYHDACDARDMGLCLIDAGHFATENIFMPQLLGLVENEAKVQGLDVSFILSNMNINPFIEV